MLGAPQSASKCIRERVHIVDMDKTERTMVNLNEVPVIAADQFDVWIRRHPVQRFVIYILLIGRVFVSAKNIDPNNRIEVGR